MTSAEMNMATGPSIAEYEEMVSGIWDWSADGSNQNAYLVLEEN